MNLKLWTLVLLLPCSLAAANKADQRKQISEIRYTVGGIASILPGFGIGHAIQGRWLESGWLFTTSELGGALLLTYTTANCLGKRSDIGGLCFEDSTKRGLGLTIYAIMLGVRIAEIVSAWKIDSDKYEIVAKPKERTTYSLLPYFHNDGTTGVQLAVSLPIP